MTKSDNARINSAFHGTGLEEKLLHAIADSEGNLPPEK